MKNSGHSVTPPVARVTIQESANAGDFLMAEPNILATPDGSESHGSPTAGWVPPDTPPPSNPGAATNDPTHTGAPMPAGSTPGPSLPARRTRLDDTERMDGEPTGPGDLPR